MKKYKFMINYFHIMMSIGLICLGHSSFASEKTPVHSTMKLTEADLQKDEKLLREIAETIFNREASQQHIKDKMCTKHSSEMGKIWKKTAWQDLQTSDRQALAESFSIKTQELKTVMTRKNFIAIKKEFAENPMLFKPLLEKGNIITDKAPDTQKLGIRITYQFPETIGELFSRDSEKPKTLKEAYMSFDVDIIMKKIINSGNKEGWDKARDGKLTTICPTD